MPEIIGYVCDCEIYCVDHGDPVYDEPITDHEEFTEEQHCNQCGESLGVLIVA